ncbi:MAG TPA: adenylyltransferase/cytidyltransferase family protein [Candidatus Saccharimonadales bacterium]|nr:adenylyltransferase/cytidyltransferase family protein [Candidatus Saccharimonadales bacterium]
MIISFDDLAALRIKHANQKLALTSGTFDLFHVGHLNYLEQVKQYGDVIVVLLSGDARVKARKGDSRPIIPESDRARILDALRIVDYVLIDPSLLGPEQTDPIHVELLTRLQPDYYVTDGPDPRFVTLLEPAKFITLDRVDGGLHGSTSAIISYIAQLSKTD